MRIKLRVLLEQQAPVNPRVLGDAARLMARWEAARSRLGKKGIRNVSNMLFVLLESQFSGQAEDLKK